MLWLTVVTTVACCATGCDWVELTCVTSACTPNVPEDVVPLIGGTKKSLGKSACSPNVPEDVVLPASPVLESPAVLDGPLLFLLHLATMYKKKCPAVLDDPLLLPVPLADDNVTSSGLVPLT